MKNKSFQFDIWHICFIMCLCITLSQHVYGRNVDYSTIYGIEGYGITLYCIPNDPSFVGSNIEWEIADEAILSPINGENLKIDNTKLTINTAMALHSGIYKCVVDESQIFKQEVVIIKPHGDVLQSIPVSFPAKICSTPTADLLAEIPELMKDVWCKPFNSRTESCFYEILDHGCSDYQTYSFRLQPVIRNGYIFQKQCKHVNCLIKEVQINLMKNYRSNKELYRRKIGKFYASVMMPFTDTLPSGVHPNNKPKKSECDKGFENLGLFCVPCRPGKYSSRDTGHRCVKCRQEIYDKIYGQTECIGQFTDRRDYDTQDKKIWSVQDLDYIPTFYGLDGDLEVLHCNSEDTSTSDRHIPYDTTIKWQTPKNINLTNTSFKFIDDLLIMKKASSKNSGIYTCIVKVGMGKTYVYQQEIIFVKHKTKFKTVSITFPNYDCRDKHNNRLNQLKKRINKIWCYPYKSPSCVFKITSQGCKGDLKYYHFSIAVKIKMNSSLPHCTNPQCVALNIEHHIKKRFYFNKALYNQFVLPYFQKDKQSFHDYAAAPVFKPTAERCENGFQNGASNMLCLPCTPGKYSYYNPEIETSDCLKCVNETYQNNYAQDMCKICDGDLNKSGTKCSGKDVEIVERKLIESLINYKGNPEDMVKIGTGYLDMFKGNFQDIEAVYMGDNKSVVIAISFVVIFTIFAATCLFAYYFASRKKKKNKRRINSNQGLIKKRSSSRGSLSSQQKSISQSRHSKSRSIRSIKMY